MVCCSKGCETIPKTSGEDVRVVDDLRCEHGHGELASFSETQELRKHDVDVDALRSATLSSEPDSAHSRPGGAVLQSAETIAPRGFVESMLQEARILGVRVSFVQAATVRGAGVTHTVQELKGAWLNRRAAAPTVVSFWSRVGLSGCPWLCHSVALDSQLLGGCHGDSQFESICMAQKG